MQTNFTAEQLADPRIAEADRILRSCVHCGLCTATCPTYLVLGDERDSPRGRIYLIKDMLEGGKPASADVARHVDRCLSCLSCMTTCPGGVDYMHLVDLARARIHETTQRPVADRLQRWLIARTVPRHRPVPRRAACRPIGEAVRRADRAARPQAARGDGPRGTRSAASAAAASGWPAPTRRKAPASAT